MMPSLSALTTRLVYLLCVFGMVATPFLGKLIPDEMYRTWAQVIFAFFGFLNHEIAAKSNPDGTPANLVATVTKEVTTEVHKDPAAK